MVASFLLMASHRISGLTRSFTAIPKCARSTTRLGLGGLVPATAEYERGGEGVAPFPFDGVWDGGLLGVVDGFCIPASALESAARVFCISARGGVVEGAVLRAGVWPLLSSCWMMVWDRKDWMSGFTLASLSGGLREMMVFRSVSKDFSTVGILDMVVV